MKIAIVPIMYRITMNGTIFSVTAAIRFRPPTTTSPTRIMITRPVTHVGTPNTFIMFPEMALTCVMLPMPKEATRQKNAKSPASTFPMPLQPFFAPRPSRR